MGSTAVEIGNLGLNLKKVQEKFMEWTGDTFKSSLLEDKKNQENMLLNGKGILPMFTTSTQLVQRIEYVKIILIAFFLKKTYYYVIHGFLLLTEKMKHLEETINQYHVQSEKNLEGKKSFKKRNPSGNWVILIFSGQKLCTRII